MNSSHDDMPTRAEPDTNTDLDEPGTESSRGHQVGRYIIVDTIGRGGMGHVFSAYDPELDRRVALKLVKVSGRTSGDRARDRMLREAQALAQLAHPNVVTVFDAGTHDDHVFIAMEQIQGTTLAKWIKQGEHPWTEVIDVMRQVGRGLAAAHAVGLVHRDFKPANVMIGEDDRPRVLDFGLARRYEPGASDEKVLEPDAIELVFESLERSGSSLDVALTETGMVLGTPGYMAPEQFMGGFIDASTDQFAFCVVLYRSLFGSAPFKGDDFVVLGRAVARGELVPPPRQRGVPRSVYQALERGLSVSRGDRFDRMESLLAVLDHARDAPRRRRWAIGLVAVTAAVATAAVIGRETSQPVGPQCEGVELRIESAWNPERREALEAAFERSGSALAEQTSRRVVSALDAYADEWRTARVDACEATVVRKEQSDALMDLRVACLSGRHNELSALVDVLETADEAVVTRAVDAVQQLPSIDWCNDNHALQADVRPPEDPAVRAEAEQIGEGLASAWASLMAGRYAAGREQAAALLEQARALGHPATQAEVGRILGMAENRSGRTERAAEVLDEALWAAVQSGHLREQIWVLAELASLEANHRPEGGIALRHIRHAEAVLARLGPNPWLRAVVTLQRGTVFMRRRQWDEAAASYREVIALAEEYPSAESAKLSAMSNMAMNYAVRGRFADAQREGEAALVIAKRDLGEGHPKTIQIMLNLATMAMEQGKPEDAIARLSRVLEIQEANLESNHPMLAQALSNLGTAYSQLGDWKAVLGSGQRALQIKRATLEPDDTSIAVSAANVADALLWTGELEDARSLYEEALRIFKEAPERIYVLPGLGMVLLKLGEREPARAMLEEGLRRLTDAPMSDRDRAVVTFELSRLQWELGDHVPARAGIERAQQLLSTAEGRSLRVRREMDAWLRKHPEP